MKQVLTLLLLASCTYCTSQSSPKETQILFIGNSLTYTNDLPGLVQKEGKESGHSIETTTVAYPNYGLIDHWEDGDIQNLIESNRFDYVIIQQGPSSQQEGREWLIEYGKLITGLSANTKTKLVYFMVWPSRTYYHTFYGVIKNHTDAAKLNSAILCPVGKVWKEFFDETGDFSYYGGDGFHPSLKGSRVAAEVIVATLFNKKGNQQ